MAAAWFAGDMPDDDVIAGVALRYRRLIALWQEARASAAGEVRAA